MQCTSRSGFAANSESSDLAGAYVSGSNIVAASLWPYSGVMGEHLDEKWMRLAIETATQDGADPAKTPIGCVIVLDGKVLAAQRNQTDPLNDATAHAEMMAIRRAGAKHGNMELRGATLYSTLQPCGMCTMASVWSKVGRVVYGAEREDVHPMYFEARHIDTIGFVHAAYRDDIEIEGGCLRQECAALYYGPDDDVPVDDQGNL